MSAAPLTINDFAVLTTWPIQWGDQDLYGHVNNTIYLRWFESGRIEYLERIAFDRLLTELGIGPILASVTCNFRRQLRYPGKVRIGSRITRIGRTSVTMEHAVFGPNDDAVADGTSTVVCFHYAQQKPIPVPEETRQKIGELEGRTF